MRLLTIAILFSSACFAQAKVLVDFAVVPCNDGGIQLEIHRDGFDIEIDIGPDGRIKSGLVIAERLT